MNALEKMEEDRKGFSDFKPENLDDAWINYNYFVKASLILKTPLVTGNEISDAMMLGAIGLAGETGEVADIHKKMFFHHKSTNRDHLKEELGDVLWYYTLLLQVHGFTFAEIMQGNMEKLEKRYGVRR